MARRKFWNGFAVGTAVGAAAGVGSFLAARAVRRAPESRILRLEKSVQIGHPLEEVFAAWSNLNQLPQFVPMIQRLHQDGEVSHWQVRVNGRLVEFDAETIQFVPNQAIGWKSVTGPKHTGRIYFSPLGNDTLVHVIMNYRPAGGFMGRFVSPVAGLLDQALEQALRDFKASLEGKGQQRTMGAEPLRATGTYGPAAGGPGPLPRGAEPGSNEPGGPVEWTRPTQPASTYSGNPNLPAKGKKI